MRKRLRLGKKYNPEFEKFFLEHASVDAEGKISVKDCYAFIGFNIQWNGTLISMTYANAVWFLHHKRWPRSGYRVDHVNDLTFDNRPSNLQELTELENQKKRRGRIVYRSYGKGKYGYGMSVHYDKRDGYFYIGRNISRGFGEGDLKGIKVSLGRAATLEEAEQCVKAYITEIQEKGLNHIPIGPTKKAAAATIKADALIPKMKKLRKEGKTYQQIADTLGIRMGAVYKRLV